MGPSQRRDWYFLRWDDVVARSRGYQADGSAEARTTEPGRLLSNGLRTVG